MRLATFVALLLLPSPIAGCATRLLDPGLGEGPGGAASDAESPPADLGPPDLWRGGQPLPTGGTCGPNRCRKDEVCCNAHCGICTFPDECADLGCPG